MQHQSAMWQDLYIIVKISYYDLLGNNKKNLMKIGKKMLNATLECHVIEPHTFLHEVSVFIYIYIYILIAYNNKTIYINNDLYKSKY